MQVLCTEDTDAHQRHAIPCQKCKSKRQKENIKQKGQG
jgi:hypothetical protein